MSRGGEEPVNIYGISAEDAETLKVIICKIEHNATLEQFVEPGGQKPASGKSGGHSLLYVTGCDLHFSPFLLTNTQSEDGKGVHGFTKNKKETIKYVMILDN